MVEKPNQNQEIIVLTEELGADGHLIENVATRIASAVADIRSQSKDILDASSKFSFDQFSTLKQILGEKAEIMGHAVRAGIHTTDKDWELLKSAGENLSSLRGMVLNWKLPGSAETLGEKIAQLTKPPTATTT